MQTLPHKHRRLVDDSLAYWKPVQANKNRRDVVVVTSPGDHAVCRVPHGLESLKINISDTGQKTVAVVDDEGQVRRTRRSLDAESPKTLVHAFITLRIDGCNTVLQFY